MTPQQIDAMKLALEVLESFVQPNSCEHGYWWEDCPNDACEKVKDMKAITAIKEALAQPEQEPVAWRAPNWGHSDDEWIYRDFDDPVLIADGKPSPNNEPLYTTPPQRKPLTGWQPIETAPKDGSSYLIADCVRGFVAPHIRGVIHDNPGTNWDWQYGEQATHWMPLPDSPTTTEAAHGIRENT